MVFTFFIRLSGCCKQRCHHQWSVLRQACNSHRAVPGLLRDWCFWTWFHRNPKGVFHLITSWLFKCLQESLVLVYWRKVWLHWIWFCRLWTETRWQRGLPQELDPVQGGLWVPLTRWHHWVLAGQREDPPADDQLEHADSAEDRAGWLGRQQKVRYNDDNRLCKRRKNMPF